MRCCSCCCAITRSCCASISCWSRSVFLAWSSIICLSSSCCCCKVGLAGLSSLGIGRGLLSLFSSTGIFLAGLFGISGGALPPPPLPLGSFSPSISPGVLGSFRSFFFFFFFLADLALTWSCSAMSFSLSPFCFLTPPSLLPSLKLPPLTALVTLSSSFAKTTPPPPPCPVMPLIGPGIIAPSIIPELPSASSIMADSTASVSHGCSKRTLTAFRSAGLGQQQHS
mmetsp:Transcript_21166/g.44157  ORF Transcript_21166/g.44157 Transcript_21166/m.44157 type:complete len:225 (+) Transcript_21166:803-1477(+)